MTGRQKSVFMACIVAVSVGWLSHLEAQVGKPVTIVDANKVSEAELARMPHVTAALAKTIVEKRPYANMLALDALLGSALSKEQRTELYGRLFVPLNLNAATPEEIQLIPGVGPRMTKEFLEYRPYTALAVFHREIGKYVDNTELARLEQYVFVPVK
jgi:radical SAM superfamily enzyme with C-terminal helix-hairpin-helix motif